ncbi:MAG: SDR family NAD(P)-dependent oxidoreductase [Rubrivivax sp.]|nr:SDR family NAD(P)-dependent oxidoreductase [Rubrivivax sp.]
MYTAPLAIVTGASRGLGTALAEQLAASGHTVLGLSRRTAALPASVEQWPVDLAEAGPVAERLAQWLRERRGAPSAVLINNAGVVSRPAPLEAIDAADLRNAIRVGLEAPLLLTAAFLAATADWTVPRRVMLVSSGLGRRGMAGSASYCAAKAGLDNLARALALEQAAQPHGARIASVAPGVIDTEMQQQLRGADPVLFPERERFAALHRDGQLDSPATAAAKLLRLLARDDYGDESVTDVRGA